MDRSTLLEVKNLKKYFPLNGHLFFSRKVYTKAVDDVSFTIQKGETLGLVGESGCGKTTAGRTILRLIEPTSGNVYFDGVNIFQLKGHELNKMRRKIQIIFQDPYGSLNPRMTIHNMIAEPIRYHSFMPKEEIEDRVAYLLESVQLGVEYENHYIHELSGGQRQRICIARALALNPEFIVCDEPVSALDVSIRSQILNLLTVLQRKLSLTYLFISHDLSVIRHISNRVAVMYLGNIVEVAMSDDIYSFPLHPYTRALLSAVPVSHPKEKRERIILEGDPPSPVNPPGGCVFHPRCFKASDICKQVKPELKPSQNNGDHLVACHHVKETPMAP